MSVQPVTFALIDATRQSSLSCPASSRYATPIANMPLICHVLDELAQNGIERVGVLAAVEASAELWRVLDGGRPWGIQVRHVDAPVIDARHMVLSELDRALAEEPVLLHPGDCLLRGQITAMQERFGAGDVDAVLPEQASTADRSNGDGQRVSDDVVVLGDGTRSLIGELIGHPADADDLVAALLHSDCRLAVCAETASWCYSDDTPALLAANRMMLEQLAVPAEETTFGDGNEIHGRVAISPDAIISNCVVHGPVAIDAGVRIEDSFVGPYTAIGRGVALSGVEIDNSMVLAGAEIRHPGFRIEGSIIGERCIVMRGFELPRGLHMRLRPDSRVTFS